MPEAVDRVSGRGQYHSTPGPKALFSGLRALDPLLQRSIILGLPLVSIAPKFGLSAPSPLIAGGPLITTLGLNLRPAQAVIWGMSVGSAVKQIFWAVFIAKEPMDVGSSVGVSIFNTICNSINTLLFTAAGSNPLYTAPSSFYVGMGLYVMGILTETLAEVQRKNFKDKPETQGKPYAGGLFGLARNINYTGYVLWRTGYSCAAGGPVWAAVTAAFFTYDFVSRGIPVLDDYCEKRYGEQWKIVRRKVPYKMIPGIW